MGGTPSSPCLDEYLKVSRAPSKHKIRAKPAQPKMYSSLKVVKVVSALRASAARDRCLLWLCDCNITKISFLGALKLHLHLFVSLGLMVWQCPVLMSLRIASFNKTQVEYERDYVFNNKSGLARAASSHRSMSTKPVRFVVGG
eukprot:g59837.t1